MICILHGYLLEGSGSNLWTRAVVRALCQEGQTVHLVCQENHPDLYDFIAQAILYEPDGSTRTLLDREVPLPGRCVMHKPRLGDTLPVYVWDKYEEFDNVVPMVDLDDAAIDDYLGRNLAVVERVVREHGVTAMHANHTVLSSVVAERVSRATGVPYVIMPHGSAIEYAVKKDDRFLRAATEAVTAASRIFVIGRELRQRMGLVFGEAVPGLDDKLVELNLGVDTSLFDLVPRQDRARSLGALEEALAGMARGRSAAQTEGLLSALRGDLAVDDLQAAIDGASAFESKRPDEDVEAKLRDVDWASDPTLLFVGRIISGKGLHSILLALPKVLEQHPRARLVVVGHGPCREAMEALVWAMSRGETGLLRDIIRWGGQLEGSEHGALEEAEAYLAGLEAAGELEAWAELARRVVRPESVIFTGYLTHRELRHLFPCCDVAIFPSVVAEAGPLVFLEAMAAGCFPLGTYMAGMAASIDSVAESLAPEDGELMKLSPSAEGTVADIASRAPAALALAGKHRETLRAVAVDRYEWRSVAGRLSDVLSNL